MATTIDILKAEVERLKTAPTPVEQRRDATINETDEELERLLRRLAARYMGSHAATLVPAIADKALEERHRTAG
jgi:hypothetical protein